MINSSDRFLALAGTQFTTMLIVVGSAAALIVVLFCIRMMSHPVAGYQAPEEKPVVTDTPPESSTPYIVPEKKRSATPGFVLPLPSEAPPPASTREPQLPAASPAVDEPKLPLVQNSSQYSAPATAAPTALYGQTTDVSRVSSSEQSVPAPVTYRHVLVFRNGTRDGEVVKLDSLPAGRCAIGRSDVPENQVVIRDDLKVSRVQHAILDCEQSGLCTIRDNNSANKVFVNEQCIEDSPAVLNHGDRVRIGLTELEYLREPVS